MEQTENRIIRQLKKSLLTSERKGCYRVYVGVDIHETVLLPTWSSELSSEFYPMAMEALQLMSDDPKMCLILWSCSLESLSKRCLEFFHSHGIVFDYVNENPECKSTEYADFDTKLYFDLGLDDKFGFDVDEDWRALYEYMCGEAVPQYSRPCAQCLFLGPYFTSGTRYDLWYVPGSPDSFPSYVSIYGTLRSDRYEACVNVHNHASLAVAKRRWDELLMQSHSG